MIGTFERLLGEAKQFARPVSQRARDLAAEHLRRENERYGRDIWDDSVIGEILTGKRDHAPAVQIAADVLELTGAKV